MGANESSEAPQGPEMTERMQEVLNANTYEVGGDSVYPYYLVQIKETEELPYGEDEILVSDCIAAHIARNNFTHIIAQTHGWNTPPDKAIAVPFTEFMRGMQNDRAMPTEDFNPIFVAFIWPALPIEFARSDDALTRTELLIKSEQDNIGDDSDIMKVAQSAKTAMENENPEDEDLHENMKILAHDTLADEDDDDDDDIAAVKNGDTDSVINRAKENRTGDIIEDVLSVFRPIMRPVENLVFGRLMKRGRRVGVVMCNVLNKCMRASREQVKVCMMANSLGAHVLVGALNVAQEMPYKLHTVFFVQSAISRKWFQPGARYAHLADRIAGPMVATYSDHDYMLKNIFGPFHGDAVGFEGFGTGEVLDMKSMEELQEDPYEFDLDCCVSVNCSQYIDEGNAVAGGHGDFKEDETTSLYWSMIKTEVDESLYQW